MANNISGASLDPIYQRLNSAPQYHPMEAETFADWAMEAGDIVTVSRDGKNYESPVHSSTVTWKKGQQVTVSSTGQEKRDSVTKMSQKKYNRGSSGLRNSENRYQQIVTSYNEMTAGLILASSSAALYVNNKYTQMQSGLFLTESSAHLYTNNKYTQMQSGLKLTESSAHLYTNNKYTQMSSGLKLTESSAHLYTNNRYTQMSSGLKLTESSAHLYTNNKYTQMSSGLKLSESSAHLYVDNKYSQMTAGLKLSESSAHLYVNNKYTQMTSGLKLSESSAHLYTNNKYTQMSSGLQLSESSAHLYVDSKYTQMQSGLAVTMSSATLYAQSRTTRAYIMTRINADGEGEALIEADKVSITGTTTINGVLSIVDDGLVVKKSAVFQGNAGMTTNGSSFKFFAGTKMEMVASGGAATYEVDGTTLGTMIKTAAVSNNQLTLTRFDGTSVNFSKATTLSGAWESGILTVNASPQGNRFTATEYTEPNGAISQNPTFPKVIQVPIKGRSYVNGSETPVDTGYTGTLQVNAAPLLQDLTGADKITANGTYTPASGYIGLGSVEIDVPGYTEGQNSVNIIKGSWDTTNARIQFTKSAGTANTQGVQVGASKSWSNGEFTATIKDYYDNQEGVDTGCRVTTDIGTPSSTNPEAKPSTESIAGRTRIGTSGISKATLSGPGYIFFSITVRGKELKYYITVNP